MNSLFSSVRVGTIKTNIKTLCRSIVLQFIVWFSAKHYAGIQTTGL